MRIAIAAWIATLLVSCAIGIASDAPPKRIGNSRQLFVDDRIADSAQGLKRVWHQPRKESAPILTKVRPWEGRGPWVYGTVLRDPSSGQFKLWYNCYVGGRPDYFTCYATSPDGLQWDRPACDAVSDPRLPDGNNVVMLGSGLPDYRQCISPSVLFRPDEPDPARRYAMLYWDINAGQTIQFLGLCIAYSPDGIHWTNDARNPVFDGVSDVVDAQYDPVGKRYLLHYKMWRVEGDVVSSNLPRGQAARVTYWPTWETVKLDGERVRYQGQIVDYSAGDTSPMTGSVDFAREPTYRRVVARAESMDLIHWTDARLCFELPEVNDAPNLSTYGMSTFSYEGLLLGLLRVFHNEREIDLELALSADDRSWKRTTPGQPFIPLGTGGEFDAGMVFSANSPVVVGDELWFYYGAFTGHHAVADADQNVSIGLAKLRRDGFVSFTASNETGVLLTVPLEFDGDQLLVNAAAVNGELTVELRDARGVPHPGFTFADCDSFHGDAVSYPVTWRGSSDLDRFRGKPIRLAVRMKDARIYAFQFQLAK